MIGDEILVTVMEISGSTVRLGIEAPQGISIFREEIWLAVKEENRAAAEASAEALPAADVLPSAEVLPATDAGPQVDAPPAEPQVDTAPARVTEQEPEPGPS